MVRKFFVFLLCFLVCLGVAASAWASVTIDDSTFPDPHFQQYVRDNYDTDDNGEIDDDVLVDTTSIVMNLTDSSIASLKGIEKFPNLAYLNFWGGNIESIDLYEALNLVSLDCVGNNLTKIELPASSLSKLQYLKCSDNKLETLPDLSSYPSIVSIDCSNNLLTGLTLSNDALVYLNCGNNELTYIGGLEKCPNLEELYVWTNNLDGLDLRSNTKLRELYAYASGISMLNIIGLAQLEIAEVNSNALTALTLDGNTSLTKLHVSNNKLMGLYAGTEHAPSLTTLWCNSQDAEGIYLDNGDGTYTIDMPIILGATNVHVLDENEEDINFTSNDSGVLTTTEEPAYVTYDFLTYNDYTPTMDVVVSLTEGTFSTGITGITITDPADKRVDLDSSGGEFTVTVSVDGTPYGNVGWSATEGDDFGWEIDYSDVNNIATVTVVVMPNESTEEKEYTLTIMASDDRGVEHTDDLTIVVAAAPAGIDGVEILGDENPINLESAGGSFTATVSTTGTPYGSIQWGLEILNGPSGYIEDATITTSTTDQTTATVSGTTPHENTGATVESYTLRVLASDDREVVYSADLVINVEAAVQLGITGITITNPSSKTIELSSSGGTFTVGAEVVGTPSTTVKWNANGDGITIKSKGIATDTTNAIITAEVPANTSSSPATYTLTVVAYEDVGSDYTEYSDTVTITVAASGGGTDPGTNTMSFEPSSGVIYVTNSDLSFRATLAVNGTYTGNIAWEATSDTDLSLNITEDAVTSAVAASDTATLTTASGHVIVSGTMPAGLVSTTMNVIAEYDVDSSNHYKHDAEFQVVNIELVAERSEEGAIEHAREVGVGIKVTSPDSRVATLPASGGSFGEAIVEASGDVSGMEVKIISCDVINTSGLTDLKGVVASNDEGHYFITVTGSAPANSLTSSQTHTVTVRAKVEYNSSSGSSSYGDVYIDRASFDIVVSPGSSGSGEDAKERAKSIGVGLKVTTPSTGSLTVPAVGGSFGEAVVEASGDSSSVNVTIISCDITNSTGLTGLNGAIASNDAGHYFITITGSAPANSIMRSQTHTVTVKARIAYSGSSAPDEDGVVWVISGASYIDETSFDIVVNAAASAATGGNTSSRTWRYGFDIPSGLSSALSRKFGSRPVYQFTESEIIAESWNLDASDQSSISSLGEQVVITLPTVLPSNTGVYVMRYAIDSSMVGKRLNLHGISDNASSRSGNVESSALQNSEYVFFDENFEEITEVPASGVVYAAVQMTAGQTNKGVITTAEELQLAEIQPIEVESRDSLSVKIAEVLNENPEIKETLKSSDIKFIEHRNIYDAIEPPSVVTEQAKADSYNIVGKFNTLSVDKEGYYVFKVTLSDKLSNDIGGVSINDLKIYAAKYEAGDALLEQEDTVTVSGVSVRASFILGLLNTFELLSLSGEQLQFGAREFLMVGFLNAGTPFSLYIGKLLLALLLGGCNFGFGIIGLGAIVGGFMIFRASRKKRQ